MKYTIVAIITKREISPIVIRWRMSSPPRRSNLPKSPDPGTIDRPEPLAWIITMIIMRTERMRRSVESAAIMNDKLWTINTESRK